MDSLLSSSSLSLREGWGSNKLKLLSEQISGTYLRKDLRVIKEDNKHGNGMKVYRAKTRGDKMSVMAMHVSVAMRKFRDQRSFSSLFMTWRPCNRFMFYAQVGYATLTVLTASDRCQYHYLNSAKKCLSTATLKRNQASTTDNIHTIEKCESIPV